jgi:hypothetical protein
MLPALLFVGGCSGINTTHSVSPASFFMPGLLQADPPAAPSTDPLPPALKPASPPVQAS